MRDPTCFCEIQECLGRIFGGSWQPTREMHVSENGRCYFRIRNVLCDSQGVICACWATFASAWSRSVPKCQNLIRVSAVVRHSLYMGVVAGSPIPSLAEAKAARENESNPHNCLPSPKAQRIMCFLDTRDVKGRTNQKGTETEVGSCTQFCFIIMWGFSSCVLKTWTMSILMLTAKGHFFSFGVTPNGIEKLLLALSLRFTFDRV